MPLYNVADAVNQYARITVLNHPNSWAGFVLRKKVNRTADDMAGGLPTLGGLAVLSSEDEEDISYDHVGNVTVLRVDSFQGSSMLDRRDESYGGLSEYRFMIESEAALGEEEYFKPKKRDVFYILLGTDMDTSPKAAYEIIDIETTTDIPPFVQRYVCNRRAELDL